MPAPVPIARWLPAYRPRRDLPADAVAGVALAALLIPESLGYADVAGVPPEVGLYAALAAVLAYAVTGGMSILVVGPASAVSALSATLVADFGGGVDPVALTAALALCSGLLLIVAGALRLGWVVNFISRPVLEAFVAGLSIAIVIGQLDGLLGFEQDGDSAAARLVSTATGLADAHGPTVAIGLATLAGLLALARVARAVPGAVLAVVAGIVLVAVLDLRDEGVAVVGEIPRGLPDVGVPELSGTRWLELTGAAAALLLVGYSEGYAAAAMVGARTGEKVDANAELVGSGAANLASGLAGGLAVSGSLSKSASQLAAGARTQVSNLVAGALVLCTMLFLGPVFGSLPEPALAGVVIAAVLPSADPRRVLRLWHVNRTDLAAALLTFVLVLVWETLPALVVGVVVSLAFLVRRASFPDIVELDAASTTGTVVLRFEGPLVYANAERLKQAVDAALAEHPSLRRLVLDAEMVADLDSTGTDALAAIDEALAARGAELHLARMHRRARRQLGRSGLDARFAGRMHPTVRAAAG